MWLGHQPWRYVKDVQMWHFGTSGSVRFAAGLEIEGLFHIKFLYFSMSSMIFPPKDRV